jgi:hypothetical protein
MSCPICNGKLKMTKTEFSFYDVSFGKFNAEICQKCGEKFFTEEASDKIDQIAKKKGLWGLEKKSKISYSGNSLIVRIPKEIADFMGLTKGKNIEIHPEGKKKIVVEITS